MFYLRLSSKYYMIDISPKKHFSKKPKYTKNPWITKGFKDRKHLVHLTT